MSKPVLKTLVVVLGVSCGAFAMNVYADDASSTSSADNTKSLLDQMNAKIHSEEQTIQALKTKVEKLASEQKSTSAQSKAASATNTAQDTAIQGIYQHASLLEASTPVVTAPYLGVTSRWDASDLMVNQPTYNEDLILMQRNQTIIKTLHDKNIPLPSNPVLELSGTVEAQAWASRPLSGPTNSMIDVTGAEVDFTTHISKWVTGIIAMVYDNSAPNAASSTNAQLVTNSRVYVDHAFINVGNLDKSPFYATIGQRSLPFGHYSTYMVSNTYPQNIFKARERALLLGYAPMNNVGPYGNVFAFKGDTHTQGGGNGINNYGTDFGVTFNAKKLSGDIGASGIANVQDALGMQANGITNSAQFRGYGFSPANGPSSEYTQRAVPGAAFHGSLTYGSFTLIGEAVSAVSHFNAQDMTYDNKKAKPSAGHSELVYSFNAYGRPTNWAVGYDHSWQALALGVPQARYITTISTSFFKDTVESLEFKREINYAQSATATGQGTAVSIPGHFSNTATFQVGYYF